MPSPKPYARSPQQSAVGVAKDMISALKISQVAAHAGVTVKTVRRYHGLGPGRLAAPRQFRLSTLLAVWAAAAGPGPHPGQGIRPDVSKITGI